MSYTVIQLIAEAFYTSGIVSRQFQTVAGDQERTGFLKLNEILSDTAIESDMVPYFTSSYTFNAVVGQEKYFIPNLSIPETLTFFIQSIRYQMRKNPRDVYFGQGRADNVESLPFNWHTERCFGGSNLFIYFFPDIQYPMELTGLFRLYEVSINQDLQSPFSTADLGFPIIIGAGTLTPGNLVINGVDCAGTYATSIALVNFINANVPFVTANIDVTQRFVITSVAGTNLHITTTGNNPPGNCVTFSSFSTINGPLDQTFMPMVLDKYYINYLQYRLAERLCAAYNFILPPGPAKLLLEYQQMIAKRSSPLDLTQNKISTLTTGNSINYAQVNLGKGWTV